MLLLMIPVRIQHRHLRRAVVLNIVMPLHLNSLVLPQSVLDSRETGWRRLTCYLHLTMTQRSSTFLNCMTTMACCLMSSFPTHLNEWVNVRHPEVRIIQTVCQMLQWLIPWPIVILRSSTLPSLHRSRQYLLGFRTKNTQSHLCVHVPSVVIHQGSCPSR